MSPKILGVVKSLLLSAVSLAAVLVFLAYGPLFGQIANAAPIVIHVAPTGATSGACGSSWADPCDLQYALTTLAVPDTEIWVAHGVYTPTTVAGEISATFRLTNSLAVYGGFAMTETSREQRDWIANVTVLSGDIDNNDIKDSDGVITTATNISGANSYHVVTSVGDATTVLDGFTVTGGSAVGGDCWTNSNGCGGGLYTIGGGPTIRNIAFRGNVAAFGGGMYNNVSTPVVSNTVFSGNKTIAHSGAGVYNYSSNATFISVTFSGNVAEVAGGGMANNSSYPTLDSVVFYGNSALEGGGMFNVSNSSPKLNKVLFIGNFADYAGGGGMYSLDAAPVLTNVTFISNTTTGSGGGMVNESSTPSVTNVTFSGNSASNGGGIYNKVSSNSIVRNAILWGNAGTPNSQIYNDPTSSSVVSDSIVQGGYSGGANIITADPLFGPFGYYYGNLPTLPLLPGSPAIDAGNDTACPSTDQRSVGRPQGAHCDLGAFESRGFALAISDGNQQSTLVGTFFNLPLGVTVTSAFSEPTENGQITFVAPGSGASAVVTGSPATISGGSANVTAAANSVGGSYTVSAGATGIAISAGFSLTNTKAGTTSTLASSKNPAVYGDLVVFTGTVTSALSGIPTGNVAFFENGVTLGTAPLDASGQATFATSALLVGTHPITAAYNGDSYFDASTTSTLSQIVRDTAITALSGSNNSPTVLGQATAFTATASGSNIGYEWNFGDGSSPVSGATANHTYGLAGHYTATVTATNSISVVVASSLVTITNAAPVANAGVNQTAVVNSLVTLDGSGSTDPDGHLPLTYGWSQSGGPAVLVSSAVVSQPTFSAPGVSTILTFTLVVTDARGLASTPAQVEILVLHQINLPLIFKMP